MKQKQIQIEVHNELFGIETDRDTLLEFAVQSENYNKVKYLLDKGADPNVGWSIVNRNTQDGTIILDWPEDYTYANKGLSVLEIDSNKKNNDLMEYHDESSAILCAINISNAEIAEQKEKQF